MVVGELKDVCIKTPFCLFGNLCHQVSILEERQSRHTHCIMYCMYDVGVELQFSVGRLLVIMPDRLLSQCIQRSKRI